MSERDDTVVRVEGGLPVLLTIIFVVLKLTGNITWSWWWVISPLWIGGAAVVVALLLCVLAVMLVDWFDG